MNQIELYARGLALADGHAEGQALRYHMSVNAVPVLQLISSCFESSGIRPQKQGSVKLDVRNKAFWKTSIEGLDSIHALRGYIEGDGCWTLKDRKVRKNGKVYLYPKVAIFAKVSDTKINSWLDECLSDFICHTCIDKLHKGCTCKLRRIEIWGMACLDLAKRLYMNSDIHYKKPDYVI